MGLNGTVCKASLCEMVAPCVGARIEILVPFGSWQGSPIAPLVRARIET